MGRAFSLLHYFLYSVLYRLSHCHKITVVKWVIKDIRMKLKVCCGWLWCNDWNLWFTTIFRLIRFEVLMAVTMKNVVFWDVMLCGSCKSHTASHPRRWHSSYSDSSMSIKCCGLEDVGLHSIPCAQLCCNT
jgi:hypothetical protein